MSKLCYPKVLIIAAEPFTKGFGTGITLTNLFSGWPREKIAALYLTDTTPDTGVCGKYYKLNKRFAPVDYYLRKIIYPVQSAVLIGAPANHALPLAKKDSHNIRAQLHMTARVLADFSPIFLPKSLRKWILDFQPDVIYALFSGVRMMKLVNAISSLTRKPVIPHFMDDWINTKYRGHFHGYTRALMLKHLTRLFGNTFVGCCISDAMTEEYEKRYGLQFQTFMNCVDDHYFIPDNSINKPAEDKVQFTYVGGLHLNRWKSLLMIAEAISSLQHYGKPIYLSIYAPLRDIKNYGACFRGMEFVRLGTLAVDEVPAELSKADVLIHVESFQESIMEYIKLSLSTKIPEYMATGKPIFAFGPAGIASIQYITKTQSGVVVSHQSTAEIAKAIKTLLADRDRMKYLGENGRRCAQLNHAQNVVHEKFVDVFRNAIAKS